MPNIQKIQHRRGIYLLSVDKPEGWDLVEYYGLVTGRAIYGANIVKDFFARVSDTVGGRVGGYEKALSGAVDTALDELAIAAQKQGANAIVGLRIEANAMGPRMLMAYCYGTAVELRPRAA